MYFRTADTILASFVHVVSAIYFDTNGLKQLVLNLSAIDLENHKDELLDREFGRTICRR